MSKITAFSGYDGQLWLDHEIDNKSFSFNWETHTVTLNTHGFSISTEFELTKDQIVKLVECLAKKDPTLPPHWQSLTPELHRLVEQMVESILEGANKADNCLRKLPKGVRLSPLHIRKRRTAAGQVFPVIHWQFSDDERKLVAPILENLGKDATNGYKGGIDIPMPTHFERRQVHLTEEEVSLVKTCFENESSREPFRALYSIALDNFVNRSYDSAVMILATSIETALKWWLVENGDPISEYILTNVQSPPIDKLYSCARKNTKIGLPKNFNQWIVKLRNARNDVAHKPVESKLNPLQVARWFAIGESILGALAGQEIDSMIGFIVKPVGEKANEKFPKDSKGVVLRREVLYKENSYHIVLDTGETWRFGEKTFEKCEEQLF